MKRLVTIQDISCFGKCSQTVALPIITAMGIETALLPTALLSTHTGGKFNGYSFLSLEDEIPKITAHWKKEGISFDAIYVGYIGSISMIDTVCRFIDEFSDKDTFIHIDPAMADNGKIYSGLDIEYVSRIKKLCEKATVISPNIYEAMLLSYGSCSDGHNTDTALSCLDILKKTTKNVIITGVRHDNTVTTFSSSSSGRIMAKKSPVIDGMYFGTGDIFSSAFVGACLRGLCVDDAVCFADDFIRECILVTEPEREKYWYGVNFEKCMHLLSEFNKEEYLKRSENYYV